METVLIVVHLMIVITMVGVILLQKSEGGALGIGGGGGGGFMSGRGAANALTRTTMYLAAGFFITSIALTVLHRGAGPAPSILDSTAPATQSGEPAAPSDEPSVLDQLGGAPDTDGPQVPQSQ